MRRRRPAGLRIATRSRFTRSEHRAEAPAGDATKAVAASMAFWLSGADLDVLRVLWKRRGGESRDFTDGTVELLAPNGGRVARGTPAAITDQLRLRLLRVDPLAFVT